MISGDTYVIVMSSILWSYCLLSGRAVRVYFHRIIALRQRTFLLIAEVISCRSLLLDGHGLLSFG